MNISLTAGVPGQAGEGGEADDQVEYCPAHYDAVVDVEEADQDHGGHPRPAQERTQTTYQRHPALPQVLAHRHLQHEDGDPAERHGDEVDDQEGAWRTSVII